MPAACYGHAVGNLQIKNVPVELHEQVRQRARAKRQSVRDYVLDLIERDLRLPTWEAWLDELHTDEPIDLPEGAATDIIREAREERDEHLTRAITDRR